jgi:endonuclease-3 related protein
MAMGAILVQNTSWRNAELALENLRSTTAFDASTVANTRPADLAALIRPSGTFRVKAARALALASWWSCEHENATALPTVQLRANLLAIHGIGPETADCILLYAFARPLFIADAYARRWMYRMGFTPTDAGYVEVQRYAHEHLPLNVGVLQEAHALIVMHSQRNCVARRPGCHVCTLRKVCVAGRFDA